MQLVDTHVHINFDSFADDLDEVAAAWRQAGVTRLVHSCVEPGEFPAMQAIADRFQRCIWLLGCIHWIWTNGNLLWPSIFITGSVRQSSCGHRRNWLDFFKADDADLQRQAFWAQLTRSPTNLTLPVIVHCRDAAPAAAELIQPVPTIGWTVTGVMHCWAGTPEETQWFLDLGFYISFSGIVTFKNAKQVKASAQIVPFDRLLIETDCPFLSPEPSP
jgi:TatD DNase family protein